MGRAQTITEHYENRGSEIWFEGALAIERCEVILCDDADLRGQLLSRKQRVNSKGKLAVETKQEMRKRGPPSPDRADAVMGVICMARNILAKNYLGARDHTTPWMERLEAGETQDALGGADAGY